MTARLVAVAYGLVTHAAFLLGVALMAAGIATGMAVGQGRLVGDAAWLANGLLALQFPLLHTFALTRRGRGLLGRLAPPSLRSDLSTTLYALFASLQLIATFGLWSPVATSSWEPPLQVGAVLWIAYALSWLLLGKSMHDASLALQTGALGWLAVARGRRPAYPPMPTRGLFQRWRQPIYTSFALVLVTAPRWTADRLLLALVWGAYCIVGPLFKERRYLTYYGAAFRDYRARVPYWLPRAGR